LINRPVIGAAQQSGSAIAPPMKAASASNPEGKSGARRVAQKRFKRSLPVPAVPFALRRQTTLRKQ
jgi:hypothetical protein